MRPMHGPFPPPSAAEAADRAAADAARHAVQGVLGTLRVAQALVTCRRSVDLAGLDVTVGVLCAQILDLAPGLGSALRPSLIELAAHVDSLRGQIEQAANS